MGIIGQAFSFLPVFARLTECPTQVDKLWITFGFMELLSTFETSKLFIHKLFTLIHLIPSTVVDKWVKTGRGLPVVIPFNS